MAKVYRDTCVEQLCEECLQYNEYYKWNTNKGYGTKDHIDGLMKYGPTEYHRMSFKPVAEAARIQKHFSA
jgi:ribonuclease HII